MLEWAVIRDESECWSAVVSRDAAADERFVYAVVTTGIYCHPSCPTPTPLRQNVRFFSDPAAAEAAGFRACKRCRPTLPSPLASHIAAQGVEGVRGLIFFGYPLHPPGRPEQRRDAHRPSIAEPLRHWPTH